MDGGRPRITIMTTAPDVMELLFRKLERHTPLSESERAAVEGLPVRMQTFHRGQVVVRQGESTDESAFVIEGIVFRYKLLPEGLRQIVAMQVPGDFTDLHSLVLKPLDHAVGSATPATLGRI